MNKILFILLFMFSGTVSAAFSQFVVLTADNENEYNIVVEIKPYEKGSNKSRIRLSGLIYGDMKAWLFVCKKPLQPDQQNFRNVILFGEKNNCYPQRHTLLELHNSHIPRHAKRGYASVELVLANEVIPRSYIYIDYPHTIFDGGFYYSVDLVSWLKGSIGKKHKLKWEEQSD